MLRLLTFGGLILETENGTPVPRLRRPWLAMLAVIAAAGDRGVPREKLVAIFWPDADEERARHSARQVLYGLRQELGREVVRSVGTTLSLDPSAISSDIVDFRAALAAGNREAAVGLVRGPFLDAFYLPGASAFERWTEEERSRLASATTAALLALATEASRTNDFDAAVERWRQLTILDPLNGRYAVGFLKALAARGDRGEALAFARQHELVMRRELEADPDPDVRRIEAELRAMPSRPAPAISDQRSALREEQLAASDPTPSIAISPGASTPDAAASGAPFRRRTIAAIAAAAMLLIAVASAFARQLGWLGPSARAPATFAVGLIREDEVPDSLRQGRVLTDMIATSLARVEGLRILSNSRLLEVMRPGADSAAGYSDAARRAGATELLEGQLLRGSDGLTLEIRRVELHTGIVTDAFRVSGKNRYALVDSLTSIVSARIRLPSPSGSIADATTNSIVAYRFYEEGLRAYHQGDIVAARRLMRAAAAEDSMFAMAAWHEAYFATTGPTPDGRHVTEARRRALRLARRAPERERLLITANVLAENNDPGVVQVVESLTTRFPDDPRALMLLARVRGSAGDFARAVVANERAIALDSMAELEEAAICRVCEDLYILSQHYGSWDSIAAVQRTAKRLQGMRPKSGAPDVFLALTAARLGDSTAAYESHRRLTASSAPVDPYLKFALDLLLEDYELVERDVRRLLASSSPVEWGNGAWTYFIALRAQGRLREAAEFSRKGWLPGLPPLRVERNPVPWHAAISALEMGDAREALRWFNGLIQSPDSSQWERGIVARNRTWGGTLIGMALAAAGDTTRLRATADSVERWGRESAYGRDRRLHHYLLGMLDVAEGRDEDAVERFRAAIHSPSFGFTRINFEMAKALLRLNRPTEAIAALQPALRGAVDAANLYVSRTELHEVLAVSFDRAGMRDSAAVHYRAVVRAWKRADPQFHGRRDRAAAWLSRNAPKTIAAQ